MGNKGGKSNKTDSTKLTEQQIDFLMNETNFKREEINAWHTAFLKDCPKGQLDKKKFTEVYSEFYPNGKADKFCSQVFKVFDVDNSGKIDFVEFLIAISISSHGDTKKKLSLAFKMYDIDGNGKIDKKEMERLIKAIYDLVGETDRTGNNSPSERVKVIFDKMDTDHNGTLSEDEFINGCSEDPVLMALLVPNA